MYIIDFLICSIISPQCTDKYSKNKKNYCSCFDVPKTRNFTSSGVQTAKQETWNDRDDISGHLVAQKKTEFSVIFLFSYEQCTFAPFLGAIS